MMVGLIIVTGYTSINAIVKAELFPTEIRALGVGLPYALTVAIFSGTAGVHRIMAKEYRNGITILLLRSWMYRDQLLLRIGAWMSHRRLRRLRRSLVVGIH